MKEDYISFDMDGNYRVVIKSCKKMNSARRNILSVVNNKYFIAEILLWHFIIAALLMIVLNLRKMNWKKLRFKNPVAFVPYIYLATIMIGVLTLILS